MVFLKGYGDVLGIEDLVTDIDFKLASSEGGVVAKFNLIFVGCEIKGFAIVEDGNGDFYIGWPSIYLKKSNTYPKTFRPISYELKKDIKRYVLEEYKKFLENSQG